MLGAKVELSFVWLGNISIFAIYCICMHCIDHEPRMVSNVPCLDDARRARVHHAHRRERERRHRAVA